MSSFVLILIFGTIIDTQTTKPTYSCIVNYKKLLTSFKGEEQEELKRRRRSKMSSSNSPCAACKFLRRKCTQECVFAPYFPPDHPQKFANVHKVFGASNVAKILNELNTTQREDAVNSLAYEAEARLRDPVYGCVGLISVLQHRLKQVQSDLHNAKLELSNYIGPSAMLPILNPGFIPQIGNMPTSSSVPVLPYNMQPIFRDSQPQHHQQILDAQQQQLVAVVNSREQQEMLRSYEQQQQPPPPPPPPPVVTAASTGSNTNRRRKNKTTTITTTNNSTFNRISLCCHRKLSNRRWWCRELPRRRIGALLRRVEFGHTPAPSSAIL
ncbi:unnamed protein product [Lactuca saligna]|uniref:LOB domain-containing protein n=1 Tax=Lactuca saligna TaxID=75948 RepID=A0AA35YMM9_LACSI|nr:unnamed protein product [Lactuca saligna]